MDESTEIKSETKRAGGLMHWVYWFVVMVVLYFLSIGPVVGWMERTYRSNRNRKAERTFTTIYRPVLWLLRVQLFADPLVAYMHWWKQMLEKER